MSQGDRVEYSTARLVVIRSQTPGVLEAIHFCMQDGTAALYPAIVPARRDVPIDDQDRTDRNATGILSLARLRNCGFKKFVRHTIVNASLG